MPSGFLYLPPTLGSKAGLAGWKRATLDLKILHSHLHLTSLNSFLMHTYALSQTWVENFNLIFLSYQRSLPLIFKSLEPSINCSVQCDNYVLNGKNGCDILSSSPMPNIFFRFPWPCHLKKTRYFLLHFFCFVQLETFAIEFLSRIH